MDKGKSQRQIRVFLIDDHPIILQGVKFLIEGEKDMVVCGTARNAQEALRGVAQAQPDIVVTDIGLDGTSGLQLTEELIQRDEHLLVLVFSMHEESLYAERAILAGAKGYLAKKETHQNLVVAIRKILDGKMYLSEEANLLLLSKWSKNSAPSGNPLSCMSNRELEVFSMIGKGLSSKEIGEKLCISSSTVDTYKANIKRKLNLRNVNELVCYAAQWAQRL